MIFAAAAVSVLLLVVIVIWKRNNTNKLSGIPHPNGKVFVGNALQLTSNGRSDQQLERWARQFDGIFSIQMFNETWVILSGYDQINEAFLKKSRAFSGRYRWFRMSWLVNGNKNIGMNDPTHPSWLPMRKAIHRTIQLRGDSFDRIETILVDVAQELVEKIKSYGGTAVDLHQDIYDFVIKVTLAILVGDNSDNGDEFLPDLRRFDKLMMKLLSPILGVELDLFPWLRFFGHPTFREMKTFAKLRDNLFERLCYAGRSDYSANEAPKHMIHAVMQICDPKSSFYEPSVTREHAIGMVFDLIAASITSTSTSAYALINLLLHNPRVFQKLKEETDSVVGHNRFPTILDREAMPYTVATINELLRYHSFSPVLVPRTTLEDTSVGGFDLPAGTIVMALACFLHHDEKFWGDPSAFRPERYLDDDGKLLPPEHPNRKHSIPFGLGSRECVGELFALRRLFIFITSLVQAFDLVPGDVLVSCQQADYIQGLGVMQKPFTARLITRKF